MFDCSVKILKGGCYLDLFTGKRGGERRSLLQQMLNNRLLDAKKIIMGEFSNGGKQESNLGLS